MASLVRRTIRLGLLLSAGGAIFRALRGPRVYPSLAGGGEDRWTHRTEPAPGAEPAVDVAAAPGPDVQPLREADVETHQGAAAEAHADDRERQADSPAPEWVPDSSGTQ